ncbi:MAG: DUF3791 domain-containing protein [Thermoguttaceae bacterium]|nr:DUF3791 domain-containing protein [Thermoguttaceae bacterium]
MSEQTKIIEFVAFCIEAFAKRKRISGAKACALFARSGALDYLRRGYDVLHSMGEEWLVADVDGFLRARGYAA